MQQAVYHHANHLAFQLREDIAKRNSELLSVLQNAFNASLQHLTQPPSIAPSDISLSLAPIQQHENLVQSDPVQLEMLKMLQEM